MSDQEIRNLLWEVVTEAAAKGPGWSQESVVLRKFAEKMPGEQRRIDLKEQHQILEAWQDLFVEGKLAWGYDLQNPNSPFFHIRSATHS